MTFPIADLVALACFVALWLGYGLAQRALAGRTINARLHAVRVLWMRSMLRRDNRIADAALIGHVVHSAAFFASTSLIAIGALIGALSGLDRLEGTLGALSFEGPASRHLLAMRLMLPLVVLIHGLFQLTWSLRQLNYTIALVGAIPPEPPGEPLLGRLAGEVGGVLTGALATFNDGIRAYYFALVGLLWLLGPTALMLGGVALVALLLHRQLFSGVADRFGNAAALLETLHGAGVDPRGADKTPRP